MRGNFQERKGRTAVVAMLGVAALATVAWAAAGDVDGTFGAGGIVTAPAVGLAPGAAVQPDGKVVVCGASSVPGTDPTGRARSAWCVRRYRTDGTVDAGFGAGGDVVLFGDSDDHVRRVAVDTDGRLLLAGKTTAFTSGKRGVTATRRLTLVRLTAAGSLDATFGSGGVVHVLPPGSSSGSSDGRDAGLVVQGDGRIVVASRAGFPIDRKGTTQMRAYVARFLDDGTIDASFGSSGFGIDAREGSGGVWGLARQASGHYVLAQRGAGATGWRITRHLPGGTVDTAFPTIATSDLMGGVGVDASDRIVATGRNTYPDGTFDAIVRRYTSAGTLDTTFGNAGTAVVHVQEKQNSWTDPEFQADGRIVIGAQMIDASGYGVAATVRLLDDGLLDATYGSGGVSDLLDLGRGQTSSLDVVLAPDGQVVSAGLGLPPTGGWNWVVARFDAN